MMLTHLGSRSFDGRIIQPSLEAMMKGDARVRHAGA